MGVRPQPLQKLALLLFVFSFIRTVLAGACREHFELVLLDEKCVCISRYDGHKEEPNRACSTTISYGRCMATCPSGHLNEYRRRRSQVPRLLFNRDNSIANCPKGQESCPIYSSPGSHHECVNTKTDIDNCGGCAATGKGVVCGRSEGVRSASCHKGACRVHSCRKGYRLDQNETKCVHKD